MNTVPCLALQVLTFPEADVVNDREKKKKEEKEGKKMYGKK